MCSPHHLLSNAEETTPCYYSAQLVGRGCMRDARPTPRRYVKPAVQTEPCSSRVLPFFFTPEEVARCYSRLGEVHGTVTFFALRFAYVPRNDPGGGLV
jgi:hypothetical protein